MNTSRARGAAAALLAAAGLLAGCGSDHHANTATTTTTPPPDPNRPPAQVTWGSWQGVKLPTSAVDGPAHTDKDVATGYTDTPQGAALAAIQSTVRLSIAPDNSWPAIAATSLVSGPGKDSWVVARVQISITGAANPATAPTVMGYKVTDYAPDHAAVTIYTRYPDNSLLSTATSMRWQYKDWRRLLPDPAANQRVVNSVTALPDDIVHLEPTQ